MASLERHKKTVRNVDEKWPLIELYKHKIEFCRPSQIVSYKTKLV